jgi:hypothetical protein
MRAVVDCYDMKLYKCREVFDLGATTWSLMERPKWLLMYDLEMEIGASTTKRAFNGGRREEGCFGRSWIGCYARLSRSGHCACQPWEGGGANPSGGRARFPKGSTTFSNSRSQRRMSIR